MTNFLILSRYFFFYYRHYMRPCNFYSSKLYTCCKILFSYKIYNFYSCSGRTLKKGSYDISTYGRLISEKHETQRSIPEIKNKPKLKPAFQMQVQQSNYTKPLKLSKILKFKILTSTSIINKSILNFLVFEIDLKFLPSQIRIYIQFIMLLRLLAKGGGQDYNKS